MFSGSAFSCFYKGVTFKVVAELTETSFRQVCEEGRTSGSGNMPFHFLGTEVTPPHELPLTGGEALLTTKVVNKRS